MQSRRSSSALAVTGEVSLSFQDELASTIHRAFQVAVEIAVVEVTKLVGQALVDVREQMQETIKENSFLKTRLLTAQDELDSVRGAKRSKSSPSADGDRGLVQPKFEGPSTTPPADQSARPNDPNGEIPEYDGGGGAENIDESFCEIREDGRVRPRELGTDSLTTKCPDVQSGTNRTSNPGHVKLYPGRFGVDFPTGAPVSLHSSDQLD